MGIGIIIRNKPHKFGKSRSEQEKNIRREWGCKTLSDEQLDKCKFLERKAKDKLGARKSYFDQHDIDILVK